MIKTIQECHTDLKGLISTKNYPCVAAISAVHKKEIWGDVYHDFGTGKDSRRLLEDLLNFKKIQKDKKIPYLTFVAYFPNDIASSEEIFEKKLWQELSSLWNEPELAGQWDENFSDNPEDKNFCFALDGSAFFVVGLHPHSSRDSRRLPYSALAFNLYDQFRSLMDKGIYDDIVALNRQRDLKYQGSINPMALFHQDSWEAIQFSGKKNPDNWRCPFTKGLGRLLSWA